MNKKKKDLIVGSLCALGCETLFGLSYIFTKQVTNLVSPFVLMGWRFFIAFIVMSIFIVFFRIKINLKNKPLKKVFLIALCSPVIYFVGETMGISLTTASESGAILACIPVVSLVASTFILCEKPTKKQIIGILVTLIGVIFTVLTVEISESLSVFGYCFLLMAVISYALYSTFVEKTNEYTDIEITYIMLILGATVFTSFVIIEAIVAKNITNLIFLPFKNSSFLIAIFYQGVGCSVLAFFLYNVAIAKIGVNRTSSFIGVSTVVSIIAGVLLLGENFSAYQIIGVIIIITGVYIANAGEKGNS